MEEYHLIRPSRQTAFLIVAALVDVAFMVIVLLEGRYWAVLFSASALAYVVLALVRRELTLRLRWPFFVVAIVALFLDTVTRR